MYGIGEVARASGLGVSALRFYDRAGVLVPAQVDPVTGYRRYRAAQIRAARLVAGLRRVGMPVPDIARAVAELDRPPVVRELLEEHLRRLEGGLADARRELSRIHRLLDLEEITMTRITLPAAALAVALDAVRFAAAADPAVPMINGVLFEVGPDVVTLVATDRYRMAVAEAAAAVAGPPVRVVAPLPFADALRPLLTGTVAVELSASAITAEAPGHRLAAEPLDVDFPDHRRLAEPSGPRAQRITVDVPALRERLGSAAPVRREHESVAYDVVILTVDPRAAYDSRARTLGPPIGGACGGQPGVSAAGPGRGRRRSAGAGAGRADQAAGRTGRGRLLTPHAGSSLKGDPGRGGERVASSWGYKYDACSDPDHPLFPADTQS